LQNEWKDEKGEKDWPITLHLTVLITGKVPPRAPGPSTELVGSSYLTWRVCFTQDVMS
jgi:hypothetical protein